VDIVPTWSPTGDFIAYFSWPTTGGQRLGLHRIFVDDSGARQGDPELLLDLTDAAWGFLPTANELRISPNGTTLAYWFAGDIWTLDFATHDTTRITRVGDARWPDWHPSGDLIVYAQILGGSILEPDSTGGMHVVDLRTMEDRQLTRRGGRKIAGGHPRWDATGESIVFFSGDPETGNRSLEIFRVFPDSTDYIRLARTGWDNEAPCWWYLHGEEIVFQRSDGEDMEHVLNLDNGSIRCFSSIGRPVNLRAFDFSPDYTKVVTTRVDTTGTIGVLWVLDIESGRWTQLTAPPL
jgi:Tol biopolymer transport system component